MSRKYRVVVAFLTEAIADVIYAVGNIWCIRDRCNAVREKTVINIYCMFTEECCFIIEMLLAVHYCVLELRCVARGSAALGTRSCRQSPYLRPVVSHARQGIGHWQRCRVAKQLLHRKPRRTLHLSFYSRPRIAPAIAEDCYFGRVLSFSATDFSTSLGRFSRNFATQRDVS